MSISKRRPTNRHEIKRHQQIAKNWLMYLNMRPDDHLSVRHKTFHQKVQHLFAYFRASQCNHLHL